VSSPSSGMQWVRGAGRRAGQLGQEAVTAAETCISLASLNAVSLMSGLPIEGFEVACSSSSCCDCDCDCVCICRAFAQHLQRRALAFAGEFPRLGKLDSGTFLNPKTPLSWDDQERTPRGSVRRVNLGDPAADHRRGGTDTRPAASRKILKGCGCFVRPGVAGQCERPRTQSSPVQNSE
jgi:hypothetical protein